MADEQRHRVLQLTFGGVQFAGSIVSIYSGAPHWVTAVLCGAAIGSMALVPKVVELLDARNINGFIPNAERLDSFMTIVNIQPASEDDLPYISKLQGRAFKPKDIVSLEGLRSWHKRNPHGFHIIRDEQNNEVGCVTLLPIKPATWKAYMAGEIFDANLVADSLWEPDHRGSVEIILAESLIIDLGTSEERNAAIAQLCPILGTLIKSLSSNPNVRVVALAASKGGQNVVKKLGFSKETSPHGQPYEMFVIKASDLLRNAAAFLRPAQFLAPAG